MHIKNLNLLTVVVVPPEYEGKISSATNYGNLIIMAYCR
jgi:hypothetical protein